MVAQHELITTHDKEARKTLPPLSIPRDLLTEVGFAVDGGGSPTSCVEKYANRFQDLKTKKAIQEEIQELFERNNGTITIDSSALVPVVTTGLDNNLVHQVDRMVITSYARYSPGGLYVEGLSTEGKEPDPHVVTYAMVDPLSGMPMSTFRAKLPNSASYTGQDDIHSLFMVYDNTFGRLNGCYREPSRWALSNIFPLIEQLDSSVKAVSEIKALARGHKAQAFKRVFEHLYLNTEDAGGNDSSIPAVCIFSDAVCRYAQRERILHAEPIYVTEKDSSLREQLETTFPNYWTVNEVQQEKPKLYWVRPVEE